MLKNYWKLCCISFILIGLSSCAHFQKSEKIPKLPAHLETQLIVENGEVAAGAKGVLIKNNWNYQNKPAAYTLWYNYATKTWAVNPNPVPLNGQRFFTTGSQNFAVALFYYKSAGRYKPAKGCFIKGNSLTTYTVNGEKNITCTR